MAGTKRATSKQAEGNSVSHAVITGPITGSVVLPDGREFDVTPELITVDDLETAHAVAAAIGVAHSTNGHPTDPNFVYVPKED